jgi:hypothetical protein
MLSAMWRAALLCTAALASLTGAACGGDSDTTRDDDELAAQIDEQAAARQQQAARQEATAREPEDAPAPRPTSASDDTSPPAPASTSRSRSLLTAGDRASFTRLAATLPGAEGIAVSAVGPDQPVYRAGPLQSGVAWSTAKVPVAMAALEAGAGSRADATKAITASDNAAAERLWRALGAGTTAAAATDAQLRAAGDTRTRTQPEVLRPGFTAFGQTDWRLTDQARFMAGMRCTDAGPDILTLMGRVVPGQRWGLGTTGTSAQFKGGWGPGIRPGQGGGWLDRQMGIIAVGGKPIAIAIATTAGDHDAGTRSLTAIARWAKRNIDARRAPSSADC